MIEEDIRPKEISDEFLRPVGRDAQKHFGAEKYQGVFCAVCSLNVGCVSN